MDLGKLAQILLTCPSLRAARSTMTVPAQIRTRASSRAIEEQSTQLVTF